MLAKGTISSSTKKAENSEKVENRYAIGTCVSYLKRGKLAKW